MITWPLRFVGGLVGVAFRLALAMIAVALMALGVLISLSVFGAVVGIPMFFVGLFVLWKSVVG
ncbi:MAG: hypothetical protein P1T08_01020 [Acidimicrobiia bacterium]|nr:hypothetical protein [Acidimicrobiia bacterium]